MVRGIAVFGLKAPDRREKERSGVLFSLHTVRLTLNIMDKFKEIYYHTNKYKYFGGRLFCASIIAQRRLFNLPE